MKRFRKIYIEISNLCNLNCSFCPGTKREPGRMSEASFAEILSKVRPYTDFLYFHIMGEPLLHPQLGRFLQLAGESGFRVILTTNGTLLNVQQNTLLSSPGLHKVNISVHAFEANDLSISFMEYLNRCITYGKAAEGKKLTVFRLWNDGGQNILNQQILDALHSAFPEEWKSEPRGTRIGNKVYLEHGEKFDWPDLGANESSESQFCYALRDQIGVLWDGRVVPCCLDHEGDLVLGNLLEQHLEEILSSSRAQAIYQGFSNRIAVEELCRKCGYARRFQ